jgi:iron complex transport system substrate-binding protein
MNRLIAVLIALAFAFALGGCRDQTRDTGLPQRTGWPVSVGGTVLDAAPVRVVTLSPALTETVFALGSGRCVVGAGSFSDTPSAAKDLPACGTALVPDTAEIVSLHPDTVITPVRLAAWAQEALAQEDISVLEIGYASNLDELIAQYAAVCTAFEGKEKGAVREEQLRYYIDTTLGYIRSSIKEEAESTSAVFLQRMDLTMATGDTLEGELLSSLGLSNPAQDASGWAFPEDQAAGLSPDVIFYSDAITPEMLEDSPYYQDSPAVRDGREIGFTGSVFEYQSPRMFRQLEQIMREAFPDAQWAPKPSVVIPRPEPEAPKEKTFWEKCAQFVQELFGKA